MMKIVNTFLVILLALVYHQAEAQFQQAPLPYAYDALEPYIDARTMEIHYSKHHAGYVAKLNKALEKSGKSPASLEAIFKDITAYDAAVRNNAGGHYNHTLFWSVLTPSRTKPSKALRAAVERDFGGMDKLREAFLGAASGRFGSGWAWVIVTPEKTLAVTSTPNQDNPLMQDVRERGTPVLGADVWEHAYYLNYQNKRGDYLEALWNIINWDEVSRRYEESL
ncbi:superoxide dismutase, Fe-Mn family [Sinomicrobium oceani]|uniref:Superoxide dismutase n=2 Tax=Sinomicrobium oceani TaxID=1150368 RepID=A0A1K1MDI4_9FLAO|nr:superoxide dismutase [Sinomicrobium oceani]SFW21212.1 superoxide dismutase, Fe-Mn family [Sinomicrobium oceani]